MIGRGSPWLWPKVHSEREMRARGAAVEVCHTYEDECLEHGGRAKHN